MGFTLHYFLKSPGAALGQPKDSLGSFSRATRPPRENGGGLVRRRIRDAFELWQSPDLLEIRVSGPAWLSGREKFKKN
jgi:hypothetical protein